MEKEGENTPRHEKVWTAVVFLSFGKKSGSNFRGCCFCVCPFHFICCVPPLFICSSNYRAFGVSFSVHYNAGGANSLTLGQPLIVFGLIDNINLKNQDYLSKRIKYGWWIIIAQQMLVFAHQLYENSMHLYRQSTRYTILNYFPF